MSTTSYVNLMDYQREAEKILPREVWAYIQGTAADGITAEANLEAWQKLALRPRVLKNLKGAHTRSTLLGKKCPCPLLAAPMAYQRLFHPNGERELASAAAAQGVGFTLSTQTSTPMQEAAKIVLEDPNRGPLWFQMYLQHDESFNRTLIRQVETAGFEAIVLTADAPITGARDAERRAGFCLPDGIHAVHLEDLPAIPVAQDTLNTVLDFMPYCPDWDALDWLAANTKLPVLVKGITHPQDALLAKKHKAQGIIVSNHGGRILDTVAPTAALLPEITTALKGSLPIIVDGGIRRGTDVLKALALGASAVMVGRPLLYALACNGAYGAAHALKILKDEFEIAMALCGCKTIDEITPDILFFDEV